MKTGKRTQWNANFDRVLHSCDNDLEKNRDNDFLVRASVWFRIVSVLGPKPRLLSHAVLPARFQQPFRFEALTGMDWNFFGLVCSCTICKNVVCFCPCPVYPLPPWLRTKDVQPPVALTPYREGAAPGAFLQIVCLILRRNAVCYSNVNAWQSEGEMSGGLVEGTYSSQKKKGGAWFCGTECSSGKIIISKRTLTP